MIDQQTYSFPKVSPVDPNELRESLRAMRQQARDAARARQDGDARGGRSA